MKRIIVYPYKIGSESARNIRNMFKEQEIPSLLVYPDRKYRPRQDDIIINWGNSRIPKWNCQGMLNQPEAVGRSSDKLKTFENLSDNAFIRAHLPEYTTNPATAQTWYDQGYLVYGRTTLTGHSGEGIILFNNAIYRNNTTTFYNNPKDHPECKLFTKFFNKTNEFRVHVFKDKIIDIQEKRLRNGVNHPRGYIWNHANDFVYCRQGLEFINNNTKVLSISAIRELDLDFGAVDIATGAGGATVIFEVNTAPGITGTTLNTYGEIFANL